MLSRDMERHRLVRDLSQLKEVWDIIVIGGGATGLGIAVDAATRGYRVLLAERDDFAKGTSSRSTKLVHGGVRYLAQGNVKLVREALRERGHLLRNAPHLTRQQDFIVPTYSRWDKLFYGTGLLTYDLLAGRLGIGQSRFLDKQEVLQRLPLADRKGLCGGIEYFDGQFDDARLAVGLARTAAEHGAAVFNHLAVTGLLHEAKKVSGVVLRDAFSGLTYEVRAKAVVNATGVFVDDVIRMDAPDSPRLVAPSQGVHIVLERSFFPTDSALMIPKTDDGRVLFAVPWQGHVVVGTTDTPVEEVLREPLPLREEISFIIFHVNKYLRTEVRESDVRSVFTGLRPLVRASNTGNTALLSRDHTIVVSASGLVSITGGKWTTYRKMAKDAVDNAAFVGKLGKRPCITEQLRLHGWVSNVDRQDLLVGYGADAEPIRELMKEDPLLAEQLHPGHPYTMAEVAWSFRHEMAMTVEDVLARRLRLLFLDARAAIEAAPKVEAMRARLLGGPSQLAAFLDLAKGYLP